MIVRLRAQVSLGNLAFVLSTVQLVWLVWFFYTGLGGALELVVHVMSIALALQILFMYQQDYLYRWLPPIANHFLVAVYLGRLSARVRLFPQRVRAARDLRDGLVQPQ